jgi:hypothetical protein
MALMKTKKTLMVTDCFAQMAQTFFFVSLSQRITYINYTGKAKSIGGGVGVRGNAPPAKFCKKEYSCSASASHGQ